MRKTKDESKKLSKLSRVVLTMTCKLCGEHGHNRQGCPKRQNTTKQPLEGKKAKQIAESQKVKTTPSSSTSKKIDKGKEKNQ
ncbi:hypothetical protein DITRI_Ditri11bG0180100 [Diplodiscus trichospermus]